jgi:hypothetical protein
MTGVCDMTRHRGGLNGGKNKYKWECTPLSSAISVSTRTLSSTSAFCWALACSSLKFASQLVEIGLLRPRLVFQCLTRRAAWENNWFLPKIGLRHMVSLFRTFLAFLAAPQNRHNTPLLKSLSLHAPLFFPSCRLFSCAW